MRVAMRQGTGGKACSSPGLATGALAKVPRNESWPTLTTVSLACVSPNLRVVGASLFDDMTEGFCFFSPLLRFCWQQRPSGVPGFSVVRGQSGAGHLGLGEERGQPLSAASSIIDLTSGSQVAGRTFFPLSDTNLSHKYKNTSSLSFMSLKYIVEIIELNCLPCK